jgi:dihydrofolate reductase
MRVSVFIGLSLDGYIAREDGGLDFLDLFSDPGEDYGFKDFMESIDCLLMGRNTYEKVCSFPTWPYDKPVYVYSRGNITIPEILSDNVFQINETPSEIVNKFNKMGFSRIYLDGGITISNFLKENLVDDINLTRLPYLLGKGIPLFREWIGESKLKLVSNKEYPSGLIQSVYHLVKN